MSTYEDRLWAYLEREHGSLRAEDEQLTPEIGRTRRGLHGRRRMLAVVGGPATIAAVLIAVAVGTGALNGPDAFAVVRHADGSVTITIKEISAVSSLNKRLADLGIRAEALLANPSCTATVHELDWQQLYPRIVAQNGPAPQVSIRPEAIPTDATLLLVAQHVVAGRLDVLLTLIRSPAPPCVGSVFRLARPPSPGVGVAPRQP